MMRLTFSSSSGRVPRRSLGCVSSFVGALQSVHDLGLPWAGTIVCSTVGVRLMLVPFTVMARRASRRVAVAGPQLQQLNAMLLQAARRSDLAGRQRALVFYFRAVSGTLKAAGANPFVAFFLMPAVHIPTFVTFALAVRDLPEAAADYGPRSGLLWFPDLAAADPLCALPCVSFFFATDNILHRLMAIGASYANLILPASKAQDLSFPAVITNAVSFLVFLAENKAYENTTGAALAHRHLSHHPPAPGGLPPLLAHFHRVSFFAQIRLTALFLQLHLPIEKRIQGHRRPTPRPTTKGHQRRPKHRRQQQKRYHHRRHDEIISS